MLKAVVFFLFFSLVHSPGRAQDDWTSRDAYVSAGIGDARILIPFLADDVSSSSICDLVYNGLTKVDKDLNIVRDLAESWDVADGGLTITFHLREGVRWHDREPFTAEDVRFTYETILESSGSGVTILDYNKDGFMDISIKIKRVFKSFCCIFRSP